VTQHLAKTWIPAFRLRALLPQEQDHPPAPQAVLYFRRGAV